MDFTNFEIITLCVTILIAIGGFFGTIIVFIGTIVVSILSFLIKRLISSVDSLTKSNQDLELAMQKKPDYEEVESIANRQAKAAVLEVK